MKIVRILEVEPSCRFVCTKKSSDKNCHFNTSIY